MYKTIALTLLILFSLATPSLAQAPPFPSQEFESQAYQTSDYWHADRYIADLMLASNGLHLRFTDGSEAILSYEQGAASITGAATTAMALGLPIRTYVSEGQIIAVYTRKP